MRYLYTRTCVNDFYYDRYYGMSNWNDIPPTYTDEQRLMFLIEIGGM